MPVTQPCLRVRRSPVTECVLVVVIAFLAIPSAVLAQIRHFQENGCRVLPPFPPSDFD